MFVYHPTFSALQLKKDKDIDYVISWKSKQENKSILSPQHTVFLHVTRLFGYKMGMIFDNDPLVVEQNNYATKIVNTYFVYDFHTSP